MNNEVQKGIGGPFACLGLCVGLCAAGCLVDTAAPVADVVASGTSAAATNAKK